MILSKRTEVNKTVVDLPDNLVKLGELEKSVDSAKRAKKSHYYAEDGIEIRTRSIEQAKEEIIQWKSEISNLEIILRDDLPSISDALAALREAKERNEQIHSRCSGSN